MSRSMSPSPHSRRMCFGGTEVPPPGIRAEGTGDAVAQGISCRIANRLEVRQASGSGRLRLRMVSYFPHGLDQGQVQLQDRLAAGEDEGTEQPPRPGGGRRRRKGPPAARPARPAPVPPHGSATRLRGGRRAIRSAPADRPDLPRVSTDEERPRLDIGRRALSPLESSPINERAARPGPTRRPGVTPRRLTLRPARHVA
jgi:hypothetical protein